MVLTGPSIKKKIQALKKSLIFCKNINEPGKVLDFDQPETDMCIYKLCKQCRPFPIFYKILISLICMV